MCKCKMQSVCKVFSMLFYTLSEPSTVRAKGPITPSLERLDNIYIPIVESYISSTLPETVVISRRRKAKHDVSLDAKENVQSSRSIQDQSSHHVKRRGQSFDVYTYREKGGRKGKKLFICIRLYKSCSFEDIEI